MAASGPDNTHERGPLTAARLTSVPATSAAAASALNETASIDPFG